MDGFVEVSIPVEAELAQMLTNRREREDMGRYISRMLRERRSQFDRLMAAMDAFADDAARNGLTQEIIDEELRAYKLERAARNNRAG